MDKKVYIFGKGAGFSQGYISSIPGSVLKTSGLAGIKQPFSIYVGMPDADGPYDQRTKLMPDEKEVTQPKSGMEDAAHLVGHGTAEEDVPNFPKDDSKTEDPGTSSSLKAIEEAAKKPIKIGRIEFEKKLEELDDSNKKKAKRMQHRLNLY